MSPTEDPKAGLMATHTPNNVEHSVVDNAPSSVSPGQHDVAASAALPTPDESSTASSPVLAEHQPQGETSPVPAVTSLTNRLTCFHISDGGDDQSILGGGDAQEVVAVEKSSTGGFDTQKCHKLDRQEDDWGKDEVLPENAERTAAGILEGDETEAPPQSGDSDEQEERTEGCIAPPPSPTEDTRSTKNSAGKFFKIQRSPLGGLGAFAVRELKRGETILAESPLLWTTHFRLMLDYYNLSDAAKQAYLNLHGADEGERFDRVERIKKFNAFAVRGGIAIFEIASRFNHACPSVRNVEYKFDNERGVLSFTICRDVVPAGAELLISYGGSPAELYLTYGFRCACGGCTPLTDEDIEKIKEMQYGFGEW